MKRLLGILIFGVAATGGSAAQDAEQILEVARLATTLQQQDLEGYIRKDGRKVKVVLFLRGENIQFQYYVEGDKKWEAFHMRLNRDRYDLFEIKDGKTFRFPDARLGHSLMATDLSYEDLALRFLYWPNGVVEGSDKVKGQDCWRIRLQNPGQGGRYALVYAWVQKDTGGLLKVVGYNGESPARALKRFQVTGIMQVDKVWTLRSMKVESFQPPNEKVVGITYLEFENPRPAKPRRLK